MPKYTKKLHPDIPVECSICRVSIPYPDVYLSVDEKATAVCMRCEKLYLRLTVKTNFFYRRLSHKEDSLLELNTRGDKDIPWKIAK